MSFDSKVGKTVYKPGTEDITAMRGADPATMVEIEERHLKRLKKDRAMKSMIETQTRQVESWKRTEKRRIKTEKARAKYEKSQARGRLQRATARRWVNKISLFLGGDYVTPPEDDPYVPAPGERVLFQHNGAIVRPERPEPPVPAEQGSENANGWGRWDEQLSRQFAFPMEEAARIRAEIEHGSTEGSTVEESTDDDVPGPGSSQAVRDGFRLYKNLSKAERVLGEKIDISAYKLAVARADARPPTPPHAKPGWVMPPRAPGDTPLPNAATLNGPPCEEAPGKPRADPYGKPTTKWSLPPREALQPAPSHGAGEEEWFARNSIRGTGGPSRRMATVGPHQPAGPSQSRPRGERLRKEEFFRGCAAGPDKRATADSDALGAIETEFLFQNCAPPPAATRPASSVPTEGDFQGQVEFIPLDLTCSNPEEGMTLAEMLASDGLEDSDLPPAARLIEVAKRSRLRIKGFGVPPAANKKLAEKDRSGGEERNFNEGGIDMEVYKTKRQRDPYRDSGITRGRYEKTIDHGRAEEIIKTAKELGQHPEETFKSIKGIRHRPGNGKQKTGFVDQLQRFVSASNDKSLDFFGLNARMKGGIKQSERYEEQQLKIRLEQRAREAQGLSAPIEEAAPVKITYAKPPTPKVHLTVAVEEKRPFDPANNDDGGIQIPDMSSYGSANTGGTQLQAFSSRMTDNNGEIPLSAPLTNNVEEIQIPTLSSYRTGNSEGTQLPPRSPYRTQNTNGIWIPSLSTCNDDPTVRQTNVQDSNDGSYQLSHGQNTLEVDGFSYSGGSSEDIGTYDLPYIGLQIDDDDDDDEDEPFAPSGASPPIEISDISPPAQTPDIPQPVQPEPAPFVDLMDSVILPRTCDVKRMVKPRGLDIVPEPKEQEVKQRVPTLTVEGSASALLINAIIKVKNERASRGDDCRALKVLSPTPEDELFIMKFNFDVILEAERLARESGNDTCVKSAVTIAARELGIKLPDTVGSRCLDLRTWLMREYHESRAELKARRRREAEMLLARGQQEDEEVEPEEDASEGKEITNDTTNATAVPPRDSIDQQVRAHEEDQSRPGSQPTASRPGTQPTTPRLGTQPTTSRPESGFVASRPETQLTDSRAGSQYSSPHRGIQPGHGRPGTRTGHNNSPSSPAQVTPDRNSSQSGSSARGHRRRSSLGSSPSSPTAEAYLHGIPEDFLRQHAQMANARIIESQVQSPSPGIVRRARVRTRPANFDVRDVL
ncbi:hypothetical protein TWF718_005834 [Orbilia javanica]|uniref:Uncharacterized protein n=1 Tax=Orbilia javanica TaxID=47235 RepID=A0AAN8N462_9PEZI